MRLKLKISGLYALVAWGFRNGVLKILVGALLGSLAHATAFAQAPPMPPKLHVPKQVMPAANKKFTYSLTWTYPVRLPNNGTSFYVYQSSAPGKPWSLLTVTNQPPLTLSANQASQYFQVVASNVVMLELAWTPSPATNISSYVLRQGPQSGVYNATYPPVTGTNSFAKTTWPTNYFCVLAQDSAGLKSACSNEVGWTNAQVFNPVKASVVRQ